MTLSVLIRKILTFGLAFSVLAFSAGAYAEGAGILLYMLPGDLEKDSGAVTGELKELLRLTAENKESEIYVYLGGSEELWFPDLQGEHVYILHIQSGKTEILKDLGCAPSAEESSLEHFMESCGEDVECLIFWGHGYPGMDGIGFDPLFDNDTLTLGEISAALERSGRTFRLIGFDACSMATLEAAWTVAPFAEWFAASPEKEVLTGWYYPALFRSFTENGDREMADYLRFHVLQEVRTGEAAPLTVLETDRLLEQEDAISRVLDTVMSSSGILTLSDAARICQDREAGSSVLDFLGEQTLLLDTDRTGNLEEGVPGLLGEKYRSFLNRK